MPHERYSYLRPRRVEAFALECYRFGLWVLPFFRILPRRYTPVLREAVRISIGFNEEIRRTVCNLIGIEPHIEYSSSYSEPAPGETDLRDAIHPKRRKAETILPVQPKPYYQVFSEKYGFQPDLSIIDLLMNMGPESILILQNT